MVLSNVLKNALNSKAVSTAQIFPEPLRTGLQAPRLHFLSHLGSWRKPCVGDVNERMKSISSPYSRDVITKQ